MTSVIWPARLRWQVEDHPAGAKLASLHEYPGSFRFPTLLVNNRARVHQRTRACLLVAVAASVVLAGIARAEPAMWVIRDNNSTIYLIGTVHLLRHEAEWNSEKVKKANTESTELWLEISDMDNEAAVLPLV